MSDEPYVLLISGGLLSKWGFRDGDEPDDFWDYREEHGVEADWHDVLELLVREHLLPALDQQVKLIVISTNHNPMRASEVDGVDVEDLWYAVDPPIELTPDSVSIPFSVVLETARRVAAK